MRSELSWVHRQSLQTSAKGKKNMPAENTDCTSEQQSTTLFAYLLGGYAGFMVYPLTMLGSLIILYFPYIVTLSYLYITSACYFIYGKIGNLPNDGNSKLWDKPKQIVALLADVGGKIFHGYEVCGIDNLPKEPAILVFCHGAIAVDYTLFILRIYRITGRLCYSVIHHCFTFLPGLKTLCRINQCCNYTREECVALLKQGHLVGISPGGLRDQNYGGNTYKLFWGKRKGFAQVAIDAKVPIIPVFTQNAREGYRPYGNIRPMRWLYEKTGAFFFPVFGPIPVKFRTHIGQPIPYDPNVTAEELAEKTKMAMEALRDKHQKIPGSILRGLRERFEMQHKDQ